MEINIREIAELITGKIVGPDDVLITGINSLDKALPGEISFFFDKRYRRYLKDTKASALIVSELVNIYKGAQIIVSDPKLAYARVAGLFAPSVSRFDGISRNAFLEESSAIGTNVSIYPMVYIGNEAVIGDDVTIYPGTFIGDRVRIGDRSVIFANVSIMRNCVVGKDVIIHSGCVIGSDGFGYIRDSSKNIKIPQLGIVHIDDNVEIGANTTIDRAANGRTWIKRGVKIDNLVQIAHNVTVGEDTVIAAQTGISGSVRIGREVIIGGQAGIGDHIEIGDKAMIGSGAGVRKSVSPGEVVSGDPSMPHRLWLKTSSLITRLPQIYERLKKIENMIRDSGRDPE